MVGAKCPRWVACGNYIIANNRTLAGRKLASNQAGTESVKDADYHRDECDK